MFAHFFNQLPDWKRFAYIEHALRAQGRDIDYGAALDEMDALWKKAKATGI